MSTNKFPNFISKLANKKRIFRYAGLSVLLGVILVSVHTFSNLQTQYHLTKSRARTNPQTITLSLPTQTSTMTPTPTSTPTPTASATATQAPTTTSSMWMPSTSVPIHWQWQLSQPLNISTDLIPNVTVYDIDGFNNEASVVTTLHNKGMKAICYIDVGTWENWRPDAGAFPSSVLGSGNGWPGEKWLDIRQTSVLKSIMSNRFAMCKQKGFDAIEPDNIDGYTNNTGFSLTSQDQLNYNEMIAALAHSYGLSIGQKNDTDQTTTLQPYFDWVLDEQCYQYNECSTLTPYLNAKKAVFEVEYETTSQCPATNPMYINSMTRDLNLVSSKTTGYKRFPCIPDTQRSW